MVKSREDREKESNLRFEKYDVVMDPSYGQKQYYVLVAGIILVSSLILLNALFTMSNTEVKSKILYEEGLNISYIPEDKLISVSFTNPKSDTLALSTIIQVPFDTNAQFPSYLTVYEYSSSEFPKTINYTPSVSVSNLNHFVTVTLLKKTGNYTYVYVAVPENENKLWDGMGKYVKNVENIVNKS